MDPGIFDKAEGRHDASGQTAINMSMEKGAFKQCLPLSPRRHTVHATVIRPFSISTRLLFSISRLDTRINIHAHAKRESTAPRLSAS